MFSFLLQNECHLVVILMKDQVTVQHHTKCVTTKFCSNKYDSLNASRDVYLQEMIHLFWVVCSCILLVLYFLLLYGSTSWRARYEMRFDLDCVCFIVCTSTVYLSMSTFTLRTSIIDTGWIKLPQVRSCTCSYTQWYATANLFNDH